MEIKLRTKSNIIAELEIKSGNTVITEDLADSNGKINLSEIERLVTIAREMNTFNKKSDIDFVKMIYDAFLNDAEQAEFCDLVKSTP